MNPESVLFDPEFEAILREVAANPRSSLLRVARPKVLPEIFDRSSPVSAYATGLTSAERHLLQVHRSEVAWLLRQVCLIKLIEGPETKQFVSRYSEPGKEVKLLRPAELQDGIRKRTRDSVDADCVHGLDLLVRCVMEPLGDFPRVRELASVALRLEPTDQARLMVAYDLFLHEEVRSALTLSQELLKLNPSPTTAVRSWDCVGFCFARMGDLRRAYEAYKQGASIDPTQTTTGLARLVFALQVGLRDEVLEASRALNDMLSENDPATAWYLKALMDRRRVRQWTPTSDGARLAVALQDKLGHIGGRVARVLV